MSLPILSYTIPAILGDDEGQNSLILANALSPQGTDNVWVDKYGQIKCVDGILDKDTNILTNTGNSVCLVRGLYFFKRISGGSTTRQLIIVLDDGTNEWELHYSTDFGATQTFITDAGAGSVGAIPDFSTFGDLLFITNGVIAPGYWDGTSFATAGGTQLGAPTASIAGAGVLRGTCRWKLVPVLANKVYKIASVVSNALQLEDDSASLSWSADADGSVLGYELYRTSGTGLDFYYVTYIDGRTTVAYTDNLSDVQLIRNAVLALTRSNGDAPPSGAHFNEPHKGRLWYGRTSTYPRRVWWSDPGDPDSVYLDRHYTEFTDAESLGDQLTGLVGDFEGMLVAFLRESVWTISGTGTLSAGVFDWRKRRSNAQTGTVASRTVVKVPAGAIYTDTVGRRQTTAKNMLAYLTPKKDIRLFDGDNDIIISTPKQTTLSGLLLTYAHKAIAYHDEDHGMFVWSFPHSEDASNDNNMRVSWDYKHGIWFTYANELVASAVIAEDSSESGVLLVGEAALTGTISRYWTGDWNHGASTNISKFYTNTIWLPAIQDGPLDMSHMKRVLAVILLFEDAVGASADSRLACFQAEADVITGEPTTLNSIGSASGRRRVKPQENSLIESLYSNVYRAGRYFHGHGIIVGFAYNRNDTVKAWTLKGLKFLYQVLPGQTQ